MRTLNTLVLVATVGGMLALPVRTAPSPTTKPASAAPATQKVSDAEQVEFLQRNIQAQMQELQERMFRLSEVTKATEPGDSAKLILALRRSREELILEEMKEVMDLLSRKDLGKADVQTQDVIKKLEKLKELLLSTDLDLQLALERIKKLQGAIAKVDSAIKEEKRQSAKSGDMAKANPTTQPAKAMETAKADQEQNRKVTESVKQTVQQLGEPVTSAAPALSDAASAMSQAEGKLGSGKPGDAQPKQNEATAALQQAREQMEAERQKMLAEIEGQVKKQVMENLSLMLEKQKSIRETNESLAPRLAQGSREAAVRLKALAASETHVANLAESTAQLVEDTEFSFALPPALRNIQRRAIYVTSDLTAGNGDGKVIDAERKIERDIEDLIDTFKQQTLASDKQSRCKGCKGDKNKLLAELKAVRLLQVRVNEETKEADDHRAQIRQLPAELRDKIGDVRDHQSTVRDTLDRLDAAVTDRPPTF